MDLNKRERILVMLDTVSTITGYRVGVLRSYELMTYWESPQDGTADDTIFGTVNWKWSKYTLRTK